ncbi:MAG: Dabb family protein [Ascidiaceihabitans sp.]
MKKSSDFSGCFAIRFANQHALEAYAVHPTHQKLGAQLCTLC